MFASKAYNESSQKYRYAVGNASEGCAMKEHICVVAVVCSVDTITITLEDVYVTECPDSVNKAF